MIDDRNQRTRVLVRFARNERRLRERAGLSQQNAAFLAGLHRTEFSLLERHGRMPRVGTIVRIFSVLESDPWGLLDGLTWDLGCGPEASVDAGGRDVGDGRRLVVPGPMERFGLLLTRQRLRAGRSQDDLGRMVQMHRSEISLIEQGGRQPLLDSFLQLAAGVETEPGDLLSGMHWTPGDTITAGRYRVRADGREGGTVCRPLSRAGRQASRRH
jgi:transcriptional regulator with XRE-family HTH domain